MQLLKLPCLLLLTVIHLLFLNYGYTAPNCGSPAFVFNTTSQNIVCVTNSTQIMYPNATISWMLVSGSPQNLSTTTNSLDLETANLSAGINLIRCKFNFNMSRSIDCDFNVTINALPMLTIEPALVDLVIYPSDTTVQCTASDGHPNSTVRWEFDAQEISSNNILNFNSNEAIIGDDNTFICIATNLLGSVSTNTTITVRAMTPSISFDSPPSQVSIGDSITFTCQVNTSIVNTSASVTWLFDDSSITTGNDIMINGSMLAISNVSSNNSGNYSCRASILNSDSATNTTQLTVISPPPFVSIASNDTSSPLTVGTSIEFTCMVTPQPFDDGLPIYIEWSFPDINRTSSSAAVQTISDLQLTDRGIYNCSARVGNSIIAYNTSELSIVPLAPTITVMISSGDLTPLIGDLLRLFCDITDTSDSSAAPTINWIFNSSIILSETSTNLTINPVNLSHTGGYSCNATIDGSAATESTPVTIIVYQIPEDIQISSPTGFTEPVVEGVTVGSIDCTAIGVPQPNIIWFDAFNGYYSNPLNVSLLNNTATGIFTCRATNIAGSVSMTRPITIVPPAPILRIDTSVPNPVLTLNFTLICSVVNPLPIGRTLTDFNFEWKNIRSATPNAVIASLQNYTFIANSTTNGSVFNCSARVADSQMGTATGVALFLQTLPMITNFNVPSPTIYIGNLSYPDAECTGDGVPPPDIYFNLGMVRSSPVITLTEFTQADQGQEMSYTCFAQNQHGIVNRTVSFTVLRPNISIQLNASSSNIVEGESVQVNCSVETNPAIPLIDTRFEITDNASQVSGGIKSADNSTSSVTVVSQTNPTSEIIHSITCMVSIQGNKITETSESVIVTQTLVIPLPLTYIYIGVSSLAVILCCILVVLTFLLIMCCIRGKSGKRDIVPKTPREYMQLQTPVAQPTGFTFPIHVVKFSETYEMLLEDNQQKLKEQYRQLVSITAPAEEARKSYNATKNRYPDVLAFDHSRVIISKSQGTDYINANFMDGFRQKSRYIAAQGPLGPPKYQTTPTANAGAGPELNTVNDFWRMVWEHNITTIIMLTNLVENNRIKCALYWPEDTRNYGRIRVRVTEESQFCDYIIRKFLIERIQLRHGANTTRQVTQFHFVAWPDHGVPLFPISMLQFVKRVRSHINQVGEEDNAPNMVHCSAGVGRTGTFICLDIILQQLGEGSITIDIWKETSKLRNNRNHMIQEYLQYEFVHQAINEHIHFGDTECSAADFPKMITYLNEVTEENPYKIGMSRLEIEFKKLHMKVISNQHKIAMRSENAGKNRFINTMPFDNNCVKLHPIPGVAGSDYINASYIDSDKTHRAFIATQGPLKSTMEDFLRMIVGIGSNIIVMLTENTEDKTEDYFSFSHIHYGPYHIQTTKKHIHNDYVHRELQIRTETDKQTDAHIVHHFQLTKLLAPIHSMKDCAKGLLSLITGITVTVQPDEEGDKKPPMIVHCGTGNGMTGVFATVCVILQRLEYEDRIDVFNTVKRLRMQRVAMVQTADQYDLCYRTVMEYLQSSP